MSRITRRVALGGLILLAGFGLYRWQGRRAAAAKADAFFDVPLAAPSGPLKVFHLGHSLVGKDMPAMLAQLAGHSYNSQLGWGTSLRDHWEPGVAINGFDQENNHPRYRDAREAMGSGDYDAVILTEMVEIGDAIRYHESAGYLANWAEAAQGANPQTRVYLYETWHHTDDPNGWQARIGMDLTERWQAEIATPAMARLNMPIYLIPAGQVMAAFVRRVELGDVPGMSSVHDLFDRMADGTADTIHFNDIGAYLVALTHYAVLYHRAPAGLPLALLRADGTPADAPSAEAAALMQDIVWDVVRRHRETGIAQ